ncbi:MAG: amidophosphoribosyltransferase [Prevotellaceae bacterium]|jgi:amidophosphoribosyltransferase|nr:amidophosphoribosyltransferase [Prevotellaceae bacterium]
MSDVIKHECGIAFIRLLKPLSYYQKKYGSWMYGIQRLYLLMEKQHNRGQDGAGVASVKLNSASGKPYIDRTRSNSKSPIRDVFDTIYSKIESFGSSAQNVGWAKDNIPFAGELFLGHLRYGTYGGNSIEYVHPVMRSSNWKARNLVIAGNFNLTNVDEIYAQLLEIGQHPRDLSDAVTILEKIGYFLDDKYQRLLQKYKEQDEGLKDIGHILDKNLDIAKILREATKRFDGGYTIGGLIGNGDAFIIRDPNGIRPAFYYTDDEVIVVASERPVIQTAFRLEAEDIKEIDPGYALIVKQDGSYSLEEIRKPQQRSSCSFERIYFSRGTDKYIYQERKQLGEQLIPSILDAINYELDDTVFSYIPNTAETSFYGMIKGIENYMLQDKHHLIMDAKKLLSSNEIWEIITKRPRVEKIAVKDVKMRTFITEDKSRSDMVEHVYDVTYGTVREGKDNLVIIDDSIVRGTTLKQSILKILDRLGPKRIVIVSSAPQIRYPDCYGIDMTRMNEFCAFLAAIELLKQTGQASVINDVYQKCKEQQSLPKEEMVNYVKNIYAPFTVEQISNKIAQMLTPKGTNAEVKIVFQTIEGLHNACPTDNGDWYFTGNYPTPGGSKVVNNAFINYYEGNDIRPY